MSRVAPRRRGRGIVRTGIALLLVAAALPALPDNAERLRMQMAGNIFRALLAADLDLPKRASGTQLPVVFLHRGNAARAGQIASTFEGTTVRGLTIATSTTNDATLAKLVRPPAAIFLAEPLPRQTRATVVRYGIANRVIVYSPFDGDVEGGVLAGVSIEAQVRPLLNGTTLDASRISLRPLFLEFAKVHR